MAMASEMGEWERIGAIAGDREEQEKGEELDGKRARGKQQSKQ